VFQQQTLFGRPVFERARRLCLALPETHETSGWHHPNFRAGTKTFCAFEIHQHRPSIALKLPLVEFEAEVAAGLMFATPYGRGAWTSLWVDGRVEWTELTALIRRAYDGVANKRQRTLAAHSAAARGHVK
jgi:predicted DNA-binding protein (MmcQ/YjbR family)